jgi:cytosine deaminase
VLIEGVRRAKVAGVDHLVDIVFNGDRIARVVRAEGGRRTGIDAAGRVAIPGLVDAHVHLDKAFHLDAIETSGSSVGSVQQAIAVTASVQQTMTEASARAAAERLLASMVRHGTTAARVHVEIGPSLGAGPVRWHRRLQEDWSDRIRLQLVAFPQLGLLREPGLPALLEEAMALGGRVVGAGPPADDDQEEHIRVAFGLADRLDAPIDLHLDFTDDPAVHFIDAVAAAAAERGWRRRVVVGHVTSLAAMDPEAFGRRAAALAAAEVGVVSLPVTDLFLGGRDTGHRAVAPLRALRAAGVTVAIATNNTQNAFTPFGKGSLLQTAWLAGVVDHIGPGADRRALLDMVTTAPAELLGITDHGIAGGRRADVVVLDTDSVADVVAGPADVFATISGGRVAWSSVERQR